MKEYLGKGRQVYIEGRIANRSYDDKDGNKRYISEVVVQNFQFIGSRGEGAGPADGAAPSSSQAPAPTGADTSDDDDLPF